MICPDREPFGGVLANVLNAGPSNSEYSDGNTATMGPGDLPKRHSARLSKIFLRPAEQVIAPWYSRSD